MTAGRRRSVAAVVVTTILCNLSAYLKNNWGTLTESKSERVCFNLKKNMTSNRYKLQEFGPTWKTTRD